MPRPCMDWTESNSRSASRAERVEVGSSRTSSFGFLTSARAMATSCRPLAGRSSTIDLKGRSMPNSSRIFSASRKICRDCHAKNDAIVDILMHSNHTEIPSLNGIVDLSDYAFDKDVARTRRLQAGQALDQRRLAGAVRPQ